MFCDTELASTIRGIFLVQLFPGDRSYSAISSMTGIRMDARSQQDFAARVLMFL